VPRVTVLDVDEIRYDLDVEEVAVEDRRASRPAALSGRWRSLTGRATG